MGNRLFSRLMYLMAGCATLGAVFSYLVHGEFPGKNEPVGWRILMGTWVTCWCLLTIINVCEIYTNRSWRRIFWYIIPKLFPTYRFSMSTDQNVGIVTAFGYDVRPEVMEWCNLCLTGRARILKQPRNANSSEIIIWFTQHKDLLLFKLRWYNA